VGGGTDADAGIPRETVLAARRQLEARYRPRAKTRNEYELAGMLFCTECGLRLTGYSTGRDRYGRTYRYYCCQKRRKWGRDACPAGPQLRAQDAEREVCEWAEGLLEDPDAIARRMDEALARERASVSDPAVAERALAKRLSELDAKRERLLDLAADGILGKPDLTARLSAVEETIRRVEGERAKVANAASRVEEMERTKRALVEAFGTGLSLGLTWMPPRLRREVYEALGLRLSVDPCGGMYAEAWVDEAAIRFSREIERYARAIQEADRRLRERAREDPPADPSEDLERTERELARVRRELAASPTSTDTVMAEVAS
jgi:hypothetical protein